MSLIGKNKSSPVEIQAFSSHWIFTGLLPSFNSIYLYSFSNSIRKRVFNSSNSSGIGINSAAVNSGPNFQTGPAGSRKGSYRF